MALLEIKNIRKNFDDKEVLRGVSFNVNKGDVVSCMEKQIEEFLKN